MPGKVILIFLGPFKRPRKKLEITLQLSQKSKKKPKMNTNRNLKDYSCFIGAKTFEVISFATVWFYIIGLFYYIPSIVLMNLVIWLIILTRKKRQLGNLNETKNTQNKD